MSAKEIQASKRLPDQVITGRRDRADMDTGWLGLVSGRFGGRGATTGCGRKPRSQCSPKADDGKCWAVRRRLVCGASPQRQPSANSCHSCPKKLTSGMTRVKAIADVARRRNRSEEIYKAGAQKIGDPSHVKS